MAIWVIRVGFVLLSAMMGGNWTWYFHNTGALDGNFHVWLAVGAVSGAGLATLILYLLSFVTQEMYERLAPATMSIVLGLVVGYFVGRLVINQLPPDKLNYTLSIFTVLSSVIIFGSVGLMMGLTRASSWDTLISAVERGQSAPVGLKLVDTSVIIDGRISDICASGFVEGTLLVPRFVLHELQHIADSEEDLRRAKGRRGLDILKELQRDESRVKLEIIDDDPREVREVDIKLVHLARQLQAKILTNDFNLNKVAQIEGVQVLNINDLANALKPAVLPDEKMEVKIIKEGKEANQGVGYLDDGTMIVVDSGRIHMGKKVEVVVTSVLQTAAGRMIFTRFSNVLT
jgi:uncharacterized protein YacL